MLNAVEAVALNIHPFVYSVHSYPSTRIGMIGPDLKWKECRGNPLSPLTFLPGYLSSLQSVVSSVLCHAWRYITHGDVHTQQEVWIHLLL